MKRTTKLMRLLLVGTYRRVLIRHRVAAAVEHREALADLDLRTVLDVGANRGQFSLFALHSYPTANIISFEPLAQPAATFREVFADHPRVTLHNVALGRTRGESVMHVSGHDDSSSLLPITTTQDELFHGTREVRTEAVRTVLLSDVVDSTEIHAPAMLKLDVQGFELEVLQGCVELLDRFEFICAEGSFVELYEGQALADEVITWLSRHGYRLALMYGTVSDGGGRAIQADMLFRRTPES